MKLTARVVIAYNARTIPKPPFLVQASQKASLFQVKQCCVEFGEEHRIFGHRQGEVALVEEAANSRDVTRRLCGDVLADVGRHDECVASVGAAHSFYAFAVAVGEDVR